ncbi:hypothetical protein [Protaetiibacter intestinalis]|uniref:Uncharacterized protein n=1 Tax=Protaetiibacter intestinalis TaxID=2419774 RepID=A0A387B515_9MICO|nr:hypothetical protein [Protaetiibacter intestinalis]AYF98774.1 hypothetical protein D7I47_11280 [Protaetiibacter intestinalis]
MPDEAELRAMLRGDGGEESRLDVDAVIRRARARRRPRQAAAGLIVGLAAVAVVVPVGYGVGAMRPMGASDEAGSAAAPDAADGAGQEFDARSTQEGTPYPGITVSCLPPLWSGEELTTATLTITQEVSGGDVALMLANGGDDELRGVLASAPTLLLSSDGVVVGWSTGGEDAADVALAPGDVREFDAPLDAVDCTGAPLAAGGYDAGAVLAIRRDDGTIAFATSAFTPITVTSAQ